MKGQLEKDTSLGALTRLSDEYSVYIAIERHLAKTTVRTYKAGAKAYLSYLEVVRKISSPEDITIEDIRSYLAHLKKSGKKPATTAHHLSIVESVHRFFMVERYTNKNVAILISRPKQAKRLPVVLSSAEIDALIATCGDEKPEDWRDRAMIELCFYSGLRVSELVNLKMPDLHFSTGLVTLHGKGAKERIVPLSSVSINSLKDYITKARPLLAGRSLNDAVFISKKTHQALTRQAFFLILKDKARQAGIKKPVSPHKLRHTYATELLENGMDIRMIQELLGHESVSTTEIYTHVGNEHLKSVYLNSFPRASVASEDAPPAQTNADEPKGDKE